MKRRSFRFIFVWYTKIQSLKQFQIMKQDFVLGRDCVYRCCATIIALFRKSSLQNKFGEDGQLCFSLLLKITTIISTTFFFSERGNKLQTFSVADFSSLYFIFQKYNVFSHFTILSLVGFFVYSLCQQMSSIQYSS